MERILVSMDHHYGEWAALSRALFLAKRIAARVFVLVLADCDIEGGGELPAPPNNPVIERLELLIEQGRKEGTAIAYFVTTGDFEEEVIRFITENKVSLFLTERYGAGEKHLGRAMETFYRIRRRTGCRIELIQPRRGTRPLRRRDN